MMGTVQAPPGLANVAQACEPLPLIRRFPALAGVPRVALGTFPTPIERLPLPEPLWIKRDDLSAAEVGGNKVRALEFLLAGLTPGTTLLTVGGAGSTHVLATTVHARRIGLCPRSVGWRHDMDPCAAAVAARIATLGGHGVMRGGAVRALLTAQLARLRERLRGGARYIPLGGCTPFGVLGHVNAGLELAEQIAAGAMPVPAHVVLPLGTGATAAGLALAFRIAELPSIVLAARVAPRIGSNRYRVLRMARATATLIARLTGERVPVPTPSDVEVTHEMYGGAYGRPCHASEEAAALLRRITGLRLDGTYSAKAFAAALAIARRAATPTLFWLTFDGRGMEAIGTT